MRNATAALTTQIQIIQRLRDTLTETITRASSAIAPGGATWNDVAKLSQMVATIHNSELERIADQAWR